MYWPKLKYLYPKYIYAYQFYNTYNILFKGLQKRYRFINRECAYVGKICLAFLR